MAIKIKLPYKVGQKFDLGLPGGTEAILTPTVVSISGPFFHEETNKVFGILLTYRLPLSTGKTRDDTIGITFFIDRKGKLIQDQSWLVIGKSKKKIMDTMEWYLSLTRRYVK